VNGGRGTLGLLVNDPALYQQSDSLLRELRALVDDVRRNPKRYINVRMF
jgi:phospholipid/cholesterol/gamma-HCH transport system substrate-binding protein